MKKSMLTGLAVGALALTLIPSLLVFAGMISMDTHKQLMLLGFLLWFGVAPWWMEREK